MNTTNSQTQHTPGPWKNSWNNGLTGPTVSPTALFIGRNISQIPISKDDFAIAWVLRDGKATEEDRANARLIAAAPELLATLTDIAEACANRSAMTPQKDNAEFIRKMRDHARAAIAKAEDKT